MHKAKARSPQHQQRLLIIGVLLLTHELHEAVWEPEVLSLKCMKFFRQNLNYYSLLGSFLILHIQLSKII